MKPVPTNVGILKIEFQSELWYKNPLCPTVIRNGMTRFKHI